MVDQIAQLCLLPVFPRGPVTIFYEVDRYNIANKLAHVRFEKSEWWAPVSIDVLNTIFEVGLHSSTMFFNNLLDRNSSTFRMLRRMENLEFAPTIEKVSHRYCFEVAISRCPSMCRRRQQGLHHIR